MNHENLTAVIVVQTCRKNYPIKYLLLWDPNHKNIQLKYIGMILTLGHFSFQRKFANGNNKVATCHFNRFGKNCFPFHKYRKSTHPLQQTPYDVFMKCEISFRQTIILSDAWSLFTNKNVKRVRAKMMCAFHLLITPTALNCKLQFRIASITSFQVDVDRDDNANYCIGM